jgi:hypothetical protein
MDDNRHSSPCPDRLDDPHLTGEAISKDVGHAQGIVWGRVFLQDKAFAEVSFQRMKYACVLITLHIYCEPDWATGDNFKGDK